MATPDKPLLSFLQAMRAIAAMMVVFGHTLHEFSTLPGMVNVIDEEIIYYHFGVDLFFVISGFIMVYTTFRDGTISRTPKDFIFLRLLRIGPLYWILTLSVLLMFFVASNGLNRSFPSVYKIIGSFFFIPVRDYNIADFQADVMPVLGLGWTLNYEMLFYVIFALCLLIGGRRGPLITICVLTIAALLGSISEVEETKIRFWTQPIILEFCFGIALGLVAKILAKNPFPWWLPFVLGWVLFALSHAFDWPRTLRFIVAGIPATLVIMGVVQADLSSRIRVPRLLMLLGDASYSIYLSHIFAIRMLKMLWFRVGMGDMPLPFVLIGLIASAVLGIIVHKLVEVPVHHHASKWLKSRNGPPLIRMGSSG